MTTQAGRRDVGVVVGDEVESLKLGEDEGESGVREAGDVVGGGTYGLVVGAVDVVSAEIAATDGMRGGYAAGWGGGSVGDVDGGAGGRHGLGRVDGVGCVVDVKVGAEGAEGVANVKVGVDGVCVAGRRGVSALSAVGGEGEVNKKLMGGVAVQDEVAGTNNDPEPKPLVIDVVWGDGAMQLVYRPVGHRHRMSAGRCCSSALAA